MKIRRATEDDVPALVHYGGLFYEHTRHVKENIDYNGKAVGDLCRYLIRDRDAGFILVLADENDIVCGFILIGFAPFPFDPSIQIAQEMAYYVDEDFRRSKLGVKLLTKAESVCRIRGIRYLTMISMETCEPRAAEALYETLGYTRTETSYTKEL